MPWRTAKSSERASHYSYQQSSRDARHGNHKATPLPTPRPSEAHLLISVHLRTLRGPCDLAPWKPTGGTRLCVHICTYDRVWQVVQSLPTETAPALESERPVRLKAPPTPFCWAPPHKLHTFSVCKVETSYLPPPLTGEVTGPYQNTGCCYSP